MGRDPNRPVRTQLHRDGERHLDTGGTGNAAQDGYTRLGRRPRVRHIDECMSLERADRIEEVEREWDMLDRDMDSY